VKKTRATEVTERVPEAGEDLGQAKCTAVGELPEGVGQVYGDGAPVGRRGRMPAQKTARIPTLGISLTCTHIAEEIQYRQ